jgi:hypothetical protein
MDRTQLPTESEVANALQEEIVEWAAKYVMEGEPPPVMSADYDYLLLERVRGTYDHRFLHRFFDALFSRLHAKGGYKGGLGQDLRYMVSYIPGDFAYAAVKTQLERLREREKLDAGENPYPIGERYPPPPPLPNLQIGPDEQKCTICRGSGREQLTDLTIDLCMRCFGKGKYKKDHLQVHINKDGEVT